MEELRIDLEFQGKIPPLTEAEYKQLEENILDAGEVYEPIVTWNGTIVDGHNRYKIVTEHPEIKWRTREGAMRLYSSAHITKIAHLDGFLPSDHVRQIIDYTKAAGAVKPGVAFGFPLRPVTLGAVRAVPPSVTTQSAIWRNHADQFTLLPMRRPSHAVSHGLPQIS